MLNLSLSTELLSSHNFICRTSQQFLGSIIHGYYKQTLYELKFRWQGPCWKEHLKKELPFCSSATSTYLPIKQARSIILFGFTQSTQGKTCSLQPVALNSSCTQCIRIIRMNPFRMYSFVMPTLIWRQVKLFLAEAICRQMCGDINVPSQTLVNCTELPITYFFCILMSGEKWVTVRSQRLNLYDLAIVWGILLHHRVSLETNRILETTFFLLLS